MPRATTSAARAAAARRRRAASFPPRSRREASNCRNCSALCVGTGADFGSLLASKTSPGAGRFTRPNVWASQQQTWNNSGCRKATRLAISRVSTVSDALPECVLSRVG